MSKSSKPGASHAGNVFRFTLTGLIVFTLTLIAGVTVLNYKFMSVSRPQSKDAFSVDPKDKSRSVHSGPWGDLITRDIQLERPVEFLIEELATPEPEIWTFNGMNAGAVKALLSKNGLTEKQLALLFTPNSITESGTRTTLKVSDAFLLSFGAETRQTLYPALAGLGIYMYLDYPFIFPDDTIESIYNDSRLRPEEVARLKQFVYVNGSARQLVDYNALLCGIPDATRRVAVAQSLSRQSAVFAGLVIKPDTDVDKVAAYWGHLPNVHFMDIRPLIEALKRLPEGGNLSLFYLMPKFPRDRLYTYPLPQRGDPAMDCHWSTFNFCNDIPDNRFNDPSFAVEHIRQNYYQIAAPSLYGDILLLVNDKQEVKHSAVYLADNLVFTKNGDNSRQPWMIMRIPDLLMTYASTPPMHPMYMRPKVD